MNASADIEERIQALLAIRASFPELWSTFDKESVPVFRTLFAEVQGEGKSFLEIGSGHGFGCVFFALLGASEVHGLELLPAAAEVAEEVKRRLDPSIQVYFRQGDAARGLPYEDERFDVVLLIEVISHVIFPDFKAFIDELVRVVRPGGFLYISDGNNARSWKRRYENYRIWERFDQGPPTREGETVFGHTVGTPYVAARRDIALKAVQSLSWEEAERISALTFRFEAEQVRGAARRYAATGELPNSLFRRRICPIDPLNRMYIEQLIDPLELRSLIRSAGCRVVYCGPRRRLPLQSVWVRFPWLAFLFTNGFRLVAVRE